MPAPAITGLDTVDAAAGDPSREQPWSDLGLKADEYARIKEILGRRPTSSELAMYSVMWSEHCSYKSSKVHLKQFAEIPQETPLANADGTAGVGAAMDSLNPCWTPSAWPRKTPTASSRGRSWG